MCVSNLYPVLVSLLSHHFSVSLTTVAMIQSRPTSAEGDGLPGYTVDLLPAGVLCHSAQHTHLPGKEEIGWTSPGFVAATHLALSQHD